MKAAFVVALLLSIAAPSGVWMAGSDAATTNGAATAAMSSPAGAVCQLVRDFAKADKTFSGGWFPSLHQTPAISFAVDRDHPLAHASLLHAVAIDAPPLAPRPPPACDAV